MIKANMDLSDLVGYRTPVLHVITAIGRGAVRDEISARRAVVPSMPPELNERRALVAAAMKYQW